MSVFSKLVISFWLAIALSIGATLLLYPPPQRSQRVGSPENELRAYGTLIADNYERQTLPHIAPLVTPDAAPHHMKIALVDPHGKVIFGEAPQNATNASGNHELGWQPRVTRVTLKTAAGNEYTVIATESEPPPGPPSTRGLIGRLLVFVFISFVVCFALAKYLTTPLVVLRRTTQRLAAGDLTARASHARSGTGDEISRLVADFNKMADRIQSLVSAERRLTSDISHELRSPLARLNIALEIARRRTGPEQQKAIDRIETESKRLDELIGEVLKLSELETRAPQYVNAPIDLPSLFSDLAADAEYEASSKNVGVRCSLPERCEIRGDRELVRSAMENVLRNAIRYTHPGTEVEVSVECRKEAGIDVAAIKIRDHGPGVPEANLQQIFEPFFRVSPDRSRHTGGTGLGLAIAAHAVAVHGGSIRASNAPGGGLEVNIVFPVHSQLQSDVAFFEAV